MSLMAAARVVPPKEALRAAARTDVAAFPPTVQFRYQRELDEGLEVWEEALTAVLS